MTKLWKAFTNLEHQTFTIVEPTMQLHGGLFVCTEVATSRKLVFHRDQLRPFKPNEPSQPSEALQRR